MSLKSNLTHSEVFLQDLTTTDNVLYQSPNMQPIDPRILALNPEWSKVFDLGDAALVL